jgi:hypothetical protein
MRLAIPCLVLLSWALCFAAEPQPQPFVRLKVNGAVQGNGARFSGRPGERLTMEARVYGGRRAWCMEPQRYANIGRNTVVEANGEDGLTFTTGPGFRGVWKLQSESAAWWGQLGPDTQVAPNSSTAVITVPARPGSYALQVKAKATWHYDRYSQGNHVEQTENNDAEGNYTLVVEQAEGTWFSSANVLATGAPDDDLRFRLQSLQQRFDVISRQLIDGEVSLAQSNLAGLRETLQTIRSRIAQLKRDKPGFNCAITFIGSPADKAMKRVELLKKMADQWRTMHAIVTGNAQQINTMLLNTQMVFTNNVLKSVFKNYLDWGSGIPGPNDLFGAVPFNLQVLVVPSNVLDWYGNAQEDASILRNQALSMRKLGELREFYLKRAEEFIEESRKIHHELDQAKPVEAFAAQAQAALSGTGFATWKPSKG